MCPACMASAAVVAGSVMSTGGVTALAVKLFRSKKNRHSNASNEAEGRRTNDGNRDEQHGADEGRVAG